jgi:hypothetical protein
MRRIYVDFNAREVLPNKQSVAVSLPASMQHEPFVEGERIVTYDEETECEAIVRVGTRFAWVADI